MKDAWMTTAPALTIKGFSCIKELTVEFRRLVVFIGEQASGKSVTCKLYYFFTQALQKVVWECLREELGVDEFKRRFIQEFGAIFPEVSWHQDTFSIDWRLGDQRIGIVHKRGNKNIKLDLSDYGDYYQKALERISRFTLERSKKPDAIEDRWRRDEFMSNVISEIFSPVAVNYIPAGRSFFSTIQDVVFSLLSNNVGIDYFLKEFGRQLEALRRFRYVVRADSGQSDLFSNLCRKILHGTYEYDGKDQWIVVDKKHRIRLADASSGQQEALPLLMMLSHSLNSFKSPSQRFRRKNEFRILIEEPEAHLYPTAQQDIVDAIGRILQGGAPTGCIITTHSPFILCCINNVLKRQRDLQKAATAYHLHDGVGDAIYKSDFGLIDAEQFDDISLEIANA